MFYAWGCSGDAGALLGACVGCMVAYCLPGRAGCLRVRAPRSGMAVLVGTIFDTILALYVLICVAERLYSTT